MGEVGVGGRGYCGVAGGRLGSGLAELARWVDAGADGLGRGIVWVVAVSLQGK